MDCPNCGRKGLSSHMLFVCEECGAIVCSKCKEGYTTCTSCKKGKYKRMK